MRPYIILIAVGLVAAIIAAMMVRTTVPPQEAAAPAVETTPIIVAAEDIPAGSFVRPEKHLTWGEWPSEKVQSPPYLTEANGTIESFSGAVSRRTIFAGEPITGTALVKAGEGGFMSAVLQPGKRAVSISVNPTSGNAGFIFPGDQVDLILTHAIPRVTGQSFASETFIEDVRVLAVDQMLDNPENKALLAKTVTLEVSPDQAEAINVANEMGKISLSLRSLASDDQSIAATGAVGSKETGATAAVPEETGLDYFYPPEEPVHADEKGFTQDSDISNLLGRGGQNPTTRVRVIRGNETVELEFQQGR